MYRVLKPFEFFEAGTIDEAVRLLFMYGAKARVMAGGIDLVLKMRLRLLQPEYVVSIQKVPGLDHITGDKETGLRFGAMTSLRSLETSPLVRKNWSLLYHAIRQIASVPTKTMGTAIGNICVATPASDIAPALFALGAKARIVGSAGERVVPVENLFMGVGKTVLEPHEIVTEMFVPPMPSGAGCAFMKLAKTADDIAKVNVAVVLALTDGRCKEAKIALGAVAATTVRAREAENALKGQKFDEKAIAKAAQIASDSVKPITDVRSTAGYRQEMVKVLVKDALAAAAKRAKPQEGQR